MSESESQYPAGQVRDKGSFYKKIAGGVSDTSEGGLEKIIFDDMVDRGWRARREGLRSRILCRSCQASRLSEQHPTKDRGRASTRLRQPNAAKVSCTTREGDRIPRCHRRYPTRNQVRSA